MSFLISAGRMLKRGDCSCWLHLEMFSGVGLVSMVSDFFVRVSMSRRLENDSREAMVVFWEIVGVRDQCSRLETASILLCNICLVLVRARE